MKIRFLLPAMLIAAPAAAQTGDLLFLSPMGEPFYGTREAPPEFAWFDGADANKDGKLTVAEMTKDADRFFKRLDVDVNGEIDPREMERYELVIAPEVGGTGTLSSVVNDPSEKTAGPQGMTRYRDGTRGAALFSWFTFPQPVLAADTNFNRGVSAREFERAAEQRFAQLDKNGDRVVERTELPVAPKRKGKRK